SAEGTAEMIRQVKVARDGATKARSVALVSLKSIIVNAPSELRESLDGLTSTRLISRCANFRIGEVDSVNRSAKYTLRSLARRWDTLNKEITEHDHLLGRLTE